MERGVLRGTAMVVPRFRDRAEAGAHLAQALRAYADRDDVVVLALPRGGAPVAAEIARALNAPLDVFVVRKLGVPTHEELAMGAIASGGAVVLNRDVIRELGLEPELIARVAEDEALEIARREHEYREDRPMLDVSGRTVILVDDGLATGATMHAAVVAMEQLDPARVVVAVPVGSADTCEQMRHLADEVVCVRTPEPFRAVGLWYEEFPQVSDAEVRRLLRDARPPAFTRARA